MKNKNEKLNANAVGAGLVSARKEITNSKAIANAVGVAPLGDPHFEEHAKNTPRARLNPNSNISLLTSNHRGITLIALIITIIVMLILVGVTINVALNGGLFGKAREGASGTQIELDKEILASAALGTMGENGEVNFKELDANLPDGFEGSNGTYEKDGITFIVDKYGGVTTKEKTTGELTALEKYILGENGEGRDLTEIFDFDNFTFKDNSLNIELLNIVPVSSFGNTEVDNFYIKYEEKAYKFQLNYESKDDEETYVTNPREGVKLIYQPQGREGQKIKYDGDNNGQEEEWTILYDNGENVEIISMEVMGNLSLGSSDEKANEAEDLDNDEKLDNLEKAIYSYNNAITRLNEYCSSLITNSNKISVRSVGSNPNDPSSENNILYTSENLKNMADGKYDGIGKSGDLNFEQDLVRINYYGIDNIEGDYYLASRAVFDNADDVFFGIRISDGSDYSLLSVYNTYASCPQTSKSIRPVVKVSADSI